MVSWQGFGFGGLEVVPVDEDEFVLDGELDLVAFAHVVGVLGLEFL